MKPVQSKMARVALGLGIRDLAELAKVAPATISRFEAGEELKERTIDAIQNTLESAGVIFINDDDQGPGVRLRKDSVAA
ncbi:helix-turn-helix domain-containing protein [Aliihoeflea aestuarii]|jgi:transcriptional regulator with XRE-family HTH domain|uniref:helix-turn-helix domain-containing protein n=1 Tax=Aliihoeflea aestuarii TaxID=453840 RepID=UPI002092E8DC|nr:helix-turn-helix transcriptional regulator [Aliihoeflea aestuarii]